MTHPPRVSVVTIYRDAERYLAEAVESVRAQTIGDWELLLVDDGSTDGSAALARALAAQDPRRVRCLQHPGGGAAGTSASRNLGIAAARAPLVAFLDADDVFLPRRLEAHLQVLDADPSIGMVQSDSIYWIAPRDRNDAAAEHRQRQGIWRDGAVVDPPEALVVMLNLPPLHVFTCDITVRRDLLLAVGAFEDRFRGTHEDLVLFTKLYLVARVFVRGEFLAKVRRHTGSFTHATQRQAHLVEGDYQRDARAFRAWLGGYLRERRTSDPLLLAALSRIQAGDAAVRRRGWFIRARSAAFDLVARVAPRGVYLAVVRGYRSAVRYYALHRLRALRVEAERLGLGWSGQAADP